MEAIEMRIMNAIRDVKDASSAQAALVTVLYAICKSEGFNKDEALEAFTMQWDRLEKILGPKIEEWLKGMT